MTFEASAESCGGVEFPAHVGVGRDRVEADRQLRRIAEEKAGLDVEEARWLVIGKRTDVHLVRGFKDFFEYLQRVLGYGPKAAGDRVRVAEALETLPVTRAALGRGEVCWSAVRELSRVVTGATEAAWLEEIRGKTVREVEAMVAGRKQGDRPEDRPDPDLRMRTVRLELSPETYALWLEVQKQVGPASDDELAAALCRAKLGESSETSAGEPGRVPAPGHQVAVTVCASCRRGWQDGGSQAIEIGPEAIERACCDAVQLGRVDVDAPSKPTWAIPRNVRKRVFARDHHRCRVPDCRSTRFLDVHHVVFRRYGGGHEASNLLVLCTGHHAAVHQFRLVIAGDANGTLAFSYPDGRPWGAPTPVPAPPDHVRLVRQALRDAGFKLHEAAAAVDRAVTQVGAEVSLEELLRAAFRERPRPRAAD